jgi:putative restriction endonuclease
MNIYLGVTDTEWFNYLRTKNPEDVNFWQPGGSSAFRILELGAPFLFKLKSPINAIGGVGFFASHSFLPLSIAWDYFGDRNGCASYNAFRSKIIRYRNKKGIDENNPVIGCIVLTEPVFFPKDEWIEVPDSWNKNIVQGKTYSTEEADGRALWAEVQARLERVSATQRILKDSDAMIAAEGVAEKYGSAYLIKPRLGQGAFRVLVADAYSRRCAVTGEKTLPVLEAAHIKPYAESGPHRTANGLLLRSDIHKLFDAGYVSITEDYRIEVSSRIKEEYENGREYYAHHGGTLMIIPSVSVDQPSKDYIRWHNENVFRK